MGTFTVTTHHNRPVFRKGDLESECVVINVEPFSTMKSAKEFVESKLTRGKSVSREYRRGKDSVCVLWTGHFWTNENTGEQVEEYFKYIITKK